MRGIPEHARVPARVSFNEYFNIQKDEDVVYCYYCERLFIAFNHELKYIPEYKQSETTCVYCGRTIYHH